MRKKRKLRALEADLAQPEVTEALEGEALDAETEAEAGTELETEAEAETEVEAAAGAPGEGDEETGESEEEKHARIKRIVEALLFASDKPLTVPRLKELTHQRTTRRIEAGLERLKAEYEGRGIVLHEVAGGWQFRTAPECSEWVQQLVAGRPVRLSRAQLETLAIIAYRQPITRPEIDDIRGVDSSGTLHVLLDRNLVRVLGKKEEPGRPLLYGTTKEFLEFFNLAQLRDLPTLREFHELSEESLREVERLTAEDEAGAAGGGDDGESSDESATA